MLLCVKRVVKKVFATVSAAALPDPIRVSLCDDHTLFRRRQRESPWTGRNLPIELRRSVAEETGERVCDGVEDVDRVPDPTRRDDQ